MKPFVRLTLTLVIFAAASAGAQQSPPAAAFHGTPPPIKLLQDQWQTLPATVSGYSLDCLRQAERDAVQLSLKDAILSGLKNNPGIEQERLQPLRTAEQTVNEQSIFDPTVNLEFRKTYSIDPYG